MRAVACLLLLFSTSAIAAVGDPQLMTDHPWYPGELSCSTFERLFRSQAALYKRETGRDVASDEDKALASWYWRNLHFAHGEEGKCDLFGQGFNKTDWNRDYWNGLFAHGFALCGTTHSQWTAEMNALLGHCRSRAAGVNGHNSFEVYLTGGPYGSGKWVLLDHDISTVIFHPDGSRLLGIEEIIPQIKTLKSPAYQPQRQRGWRVAGLHDDDAGGVYTSFRVAEYLSGYAGPPPMVHLRPGESLRRYLKPGLEDGQTFVFWGMNYKQASIPGPARDRTWVNQPQNMFNSTKGTGYHPGMARYANAVFNYTPNFSDGSYKQGVISEDAQQVTFEFRSPYVIAATPPNDSKWGIYEKGGKNGLIISAKTPVAISVSADNGKTWTDSPAGTSHDLTDAVKGNVQYLLRFNTSADTLKSAAPSIRTVCQCNSTIIPHLRNGKNAITFQASNQAIVSAGPTAPQVEARIVEGKLSSPSVTVELAAPRGEPANRVYAASWQSSGAPPREDVKYQIDYSTDAGKTWKPVVKDWQIKRRQPEPPDFWSQSFAWGDVDIAPTASPIRVRFSNTGGKSYRKVEAHLGYRPSNPSLTQITFAWKQNGQMKTASHAYPASTTPDTTWSIDAGQQPETLWVEYLVK